MLYLIITQLQTTLPQDFFFIGLDFFPWLGTQLYKSVIFYVVLFQEVE